MDTEHGRVLTDRAGGLRPEPAAQSQPAGAHPSRVPDERELLLRAIANARSRETRGYHPRWVAVKDLLGLGSQYSVIVCKHYGFDPDEMVRR